MSEISGVVSHDDTKKNVVIKVTGKDDASVKEPKIKLLINTATVLLCFGIAFYKASYSILIPYTFFWQW